MTNDDIIKTLMQLEYPYPDNEEQHKINIALNKSIRALKNQALIEKMFKTYYKEIWEADNE